MGIHKCSSGHLHDNKKLFPIGSVAISPEDINLCYFIVEFLSIDGDSLKSMETKERLSQNHSALCPFIIYDDLPLDFIEIKRF